MSRVLLIIGATGQQGGGVVDALLASNSTAPITILAVTRNPASPAATALAAKSKLIKIIKGDLTDPTPLFKAARDATSSPVWGVFSVTTFMGPGQTTLTEETQGKALIDAALANGVQHFVQTSVDRGGDERSWDNPTDVPHFISKHNIEQHLRERTIKAGGPMTWTVIRPVAFMENLKPGFQTKVFLAALRDNTKGKRVQWVSTKDVGVFGAQALLQGQDAVYRNQALGVAGDSLSVVELERLLSKKVKSAPTATFGMFGSALMMAMKDLGLMIKWFGTEGYGADIKKCRELNPGLLDVERWIMEDSEFKLKK